MENGDFFVGVGHEADCRKHWDDKHCAKFKLDLSGTLKEGCFWTTVPETDCTSVGIKEAPYKKPTMECSILVMNADEEYDPVCAAACKAWTDFMPRYCKDADEDVADKRAGNLRLVGQG